MSMRKAIVALATGGAIALLGSSSTLAAPAPTATTRVTSQLTLGSLLPKTGYLKPFGAPARAGYRAAIAEVNDAGGVFGQPILSVEGDSGDSSSHLAWNEMKRLVDANAQVIIGPVTSTLSANLIKQAIDRNRLLFSPGAEQDNLTRADISAGHFARTVAPTRVQGSVLASLASGDGKARAAVIYRKDGYGTPVAQQFSSSFIALGGRVAVSLGYDSASWRPRDPSIKAIVAIANAIKAARPDAIVVCGYDETVPIIQALASRGAGPTRVSFYLCDGSLFAPLAQGIPSRDLAGIQGTSVRPDSVTKGFKATLLKQDPTLKSFAYSAQAFDAVVITALAASDAQSNLASDIMASIPSVTRPGNTTCTSYSSCRQLQDAGTPIQYVGPSGSSSFATNGDPGRAKMAIYTFDSRGQVAVTRIVSALVPAQS